MNHTAMPAKDSGWVRWVVFNPDGNPTGWAMGASEDLAVQHWLMGDPLANGAPGWRASWRKCMAEGYTARRVRLVEEPPHA